MKLLVHDYAGHPFQVQLSRALAARGHSVTHVYAASIETPRGALERRAEDPAEFKVVGIGLSAPFRKHSFLKRRFQEVEYGGLLAREVEKLKPDWVISANTPTEAQSILQRRCTKNGVRFVSWVQDFYGLAVEKLLRQRMPLVGFIVGGYYRRLDRLVLRRSDRVILITADFLPLTDRLGVDRSQVSVIENWAPLDELPLKPRRNAWSDAHGLSGKFCFLYSGTLGMKHNPGLLLALAERFRDDEQVRVVVISQGLGATWLTEQKAAKGLENLLLLPFQPFERMAEVLSSADVLVAILEPDAGVFSVPSKVLTYVCAQRPLLAAIPSENLAARIIERSSAGRVVPPEDNDAFLAAADELRNDPLAREEAGESARRYAERTFDLQRITDAFEELLR